ncbi:hypothetical protein SPSIL_056050 [Sporomusa silvacetica DSM 10669]|uniref:Uncharacterized protein n=1 Tax=Sporomusa silvacetica DSM 10669 TaxID=1123289 RepID=A0ABZ3IVC4_9FIRM|nr:hypothetical protein [Sporomusa silvacetica]OZC13010.1 hypothetical protein SPSIL_57300 [Sporomusa silvacetica DSM 10669]
MHKKSKVKSFTSENAKSAGDNALSRKQINSSINSKSTANDAEYLKELEQIIKDRAAE